MTRSIYALAAALAALPAAAYADPGHLADHGHGHSHWLALAILGGLAAAAAAWAVFRVLRMRARTRRT